MPEIDDASSEKGTTEETKPREKPPKNIVICSDGTGNAGGQGYPTNVWAIYNAIDINGHKTNAGIPRQIAFHDDGVGTESWKPLKAVGGAFGFGLSRNIRQLYSVLAKNFNDGDRIYLFGFSRGAFTVRSLAGLIASQGILDIQSDKIRGPEDFKRAVGRTYRQYRAAHRGKSYVLSPDATLFKKILVGIFDPLVKVLWKGWDGVGDKIGEDFDYHDEKKDGKHIECIGVWDTVDAVGVPIDELRDILDFLFRNNFHEHGLSPNIARGYHALAIDDERKTFHPVMWEEDEEDNGRVKQVWFAGVHSNVGGGYPKQGLAHVSLHWMMDEIDRDRVGRDGLHFKTGALDQAAENAKSHDMLYDSRKGVAGLYRYGPRNIGKISRRYCRGRAPLIHDSVFGRIRHHTHAYAPGNIPREVTVISTGGLPKGREFKRMPEPAETHNEVLATHYDENVGLLETAWNWIKARKVVYVLFLAGLLTLAVYAARTYNSKLETGWPSFIPEWVEKALRSFYESEPVVLIGLLAFLALLFLLRTFFRFRARTLYGRYWWKDDDSLPGD